MLLDKGRLASTASFLFMLTVVAKLFGFTRETVFAAVFGASWQMDSYLVAYVVPGLVFAAIGAALITVFIPVFTEYRTRRSRGQFLSVANTSVNLCGINACAGSSWVCRGVHPREDYRSWFCRYSKRVNCCSNQGSCFYNCDDGTL